MQRASLLYGAAHSVIVHGSQTPTTRFVDAFVHMHCNTGRRNACYLLVSNSQTGVRTHELLVLQIIDVLCTDATFVSCLADGEQSSKRSPIHAFFLLLSACREQAVKANIFSRRMLWQLFVCELMFCRMQRVLCCVRQCWMVTPRVRRSRRYHAGGAAWMSCE